jgi:nitroreductase
MDVKRIDLGSVDHVLSTTRAVRKRLDLSRPVDPAILKECIEIALQAPTGLIGQTWHFLVITDAAKRALMADVYRRAVAPYNEGREVPDEYLSMVAKMPADSVRQRQLARMFEASLYLTEHIHEVPVLVVPCIKGRVERASPGAQASLYGSIFPAVWSFQLALRARGIGSTLTTVHICYEQEVARLFNIPHDFTQAALLAVAYFNGDDFRRAKRLPGATRIHWNEWMDRTLESWPLKCAEGRFAQFLSR